MSRLRLVALVALVSGCAEAPGAVDATVSYRLLTGADACIQVRVTPQSPSGQSKQSGVALGQRPLEGTLQFGIVTAPEWQGPLVITATLHRPDCSGAPKLTKTREAPIPASGVEPISFELFEVAEGVDGGADAGLDAGDDGGADAGADAGVDAGTDAGFDGGADAGLDAGVDAGSDAGTDGGSTGPACDGGLVLVAGPNFTWRDVAPYGNGDLVWLAGAGSLQWGRAGAWHANGSACRADHFAAWATPSGRVYVGSIDAGLQWTDPVDGGTCTSLPTPGGVGTVRAIAGFEDAGQRILYSVGSKATILRNTEPALPAIDHRWDWGDAGIFEFWSVNGPDENTLFVSGTAYGGQGVIFRYAPISDDWLLQPLPGTGTVNDLSVVGPGLAFAGTENGDLLAWDGGTWSRASSAFGRAIYGVKAFSATEVYVVGPGARAGRWDGAAWTTIGDFDGGPGGYLARIRGVDSCRLWSAGTTGLVVTSP